MEQLFRQQTIELGLAYFGKGNYANNNVKMIPLFVTLVKTRNSSILLNIFLHSGPQDGQLLSYPSHEPAVTRYYGWGDRDEIADRSRCRLSNPPLPSSPIKTSGAMQNTHNNIFKLLFFYPPPPPSGYRSPLQTCIRMNFVQLI